MRAHRPSWTPSPRESRAWIAASLLFLLLPAGCAAVWGFDDLTLASDGGAPDAFLSGGDADGVSGTDATTSEGGGREAGTACGSTDTILNCGACGNVCDTIHSVGAACVVGDGGVPSCQYSGCAPGWADCNTTSSDTDGCETSLTTATSCGACRRACDTTHSQGATCADGTTCNYTGCNSGFADCDTTAPDTNGCETAVMSNTCSVCGQSCDTAHSTGATCDTSQGATCKYTGCASGYADCNTTPPNANGCETSLASTATCGGCANACDTKTGPASCNGTTCSYKCNAGSSDCNAATAPDTDGCECATPGCCGAKCETTHANGIGSIYRDCNATGTYDQAQAQKACEASAGAGHCATSSQCCLLSALGLCVGNTAKSVCGPVGGACYCWQYGGNLPGTVQTESPSNCAASCGASGDPGWN